MHTIKREWDLGLSSSKNDKAAQTALKTVLNLEYSSLCTVESTKVASYEKQTEIEVIIHSF